MHFYKHIMFDYKKYELSPLDNDTLENVFTVIIGNNGVGKSRLLSHIIKESYSHNSNRKNILPLFDDPEISKIIAITSSPFDKFPSEDVFERYNRIANTKNEDISYKYLGLKKNNKIIDINDKIFGIIDGLFEMININKKNINTLSKTFDFLGYESKIKVEYKVNYRAKDFLGFSDYTEFTNKSKFSSSFNKFLKFYYSEFDNIDFQNSVYLKLVNFLDKSLFDNIDLLTFNLNFSDSSNPSNKYLDNLEEIKILRSMNLISLKELRLWKNKSSSISFEETSSGERAILMNILGISTEIRDNSLICIDEPELSLHPKWQEKYMKLLMNTFSDYKKCHFVIATHSPSIISDLSENNCYILNMDDNKTYYADKYVNRSSDFQLVNLFKVPGYRNEYLNRISIEILTHVSENGYESSKNILEKANQIIKLIPKLDDTDPIKQLLFIIKKVLLKLNNEQE